MVERRITGPVNNPGVAPQDGWVFVSTATASTSATISFTGMLAGFDYMVQMYNIQPSNDGETFQAQLGVTGPTYRTSGYITTVAGIVSGAISQTDTTATIDLSSVAMGTGTDEKGSFEIILNDPAAAADTFFRFLGAYRGSTPSEVVNMGGGIHTTAEAMTAVKFFFSSNNISTGEFKLYKRRNS